MSGVLQIDRKRSGKLMSPTTMSSHNLSIVLRTIRNYGPISGADIARRLQSSKSTISGSIASLIDMDLVVDVGSGRTKHGRRPTLLAFNPTAHYICAIDLRWKKVNLAIVDLSGRIHKALAYQRTSKDPASLIRNMNKQVASFLDHSGVPTDKIEAIGIMIPGIVDTDRGVVRYSSTLGWSEEVNLVSPVSSRFNKRVIIYNDANALALGEMWRGCGVGYSHLAFIYAEGGLGGALIYDGKIILGADAAAGEFGKVLINNGGSPRPAEAGLSLPAVLSQYGETEVNHLGYEESLTRALESIRNERKSDARPTIANDLVDGMAQMIVGIIVIFNPQAVVVNCPYITDSDDLLDMVRRRVSEYLPERPSRAVHILASRLDDSTEVVGAAAAAISHGRFRFVLHGREYVD